MVEDLVPAARDQVTAGITAGTLADARGVVTRLTGQLLPACPVAQTLQPSTAPAPTGPVTSNPVTSTAVGNGTATPAAPTSPGAVIPSTADTAASLLPGGPSAPSGGALPTDTVLNGPLATGSALATGTGTGTPLASRAPEPGVTCRVVR
jgi:protein phosphatase